MNTSYVVDTGTYSPVRASSAAIDASGNDDLLSQMQLTSIQDDDKRTQPTNIHSNS
jgi:hypothetical protein